MNVIVLLAWAEWESNEFYPQMCPPCGRRLMRRTTFHFLFYHRFQPTDQHKKIFAVYRQLIQSAENIIFNDINMFLFQCIMLTWNVQKLVFFYRFFMYFYCLWITVNFFLKNWKSCSHFTGKTVNLLLISGAPAGTIFQVFTKKYFYSKTCLLLHCYYILYFLYALLTTIHLRFFVLIQDLLTFHSTLKICGRTFCPGLMWALTCLRTGFKVLSYLTLRFWIWISPRWGQPSGTWDAAEK